MGEEEKRKRKKRRGRRREIKQKGMETEPKYGFMEFQRFCMVNSLSPKARVLIE